MADTAARGTRLTGEARQSLAAQLRARYEDGASIRDLAAETGRSYGFVHGLLVENGVTLRGRGGSTKSRSA